MASSANDGQEYADPLHNAVLAYVVQYFKSNKSEIGLTGYMHRYVPLIAHMLSDAGLTGEAVSKHGDPNQLIKGTLIGIFKGKTICEVGCRYGTFLKFIKEHGNSKTRVIGTTLDPDAVNLAEEKVIGKNNIFRSPVENAHVLIDRENVDIVVSLNHWDKGRFYVPKADWNGSEIKLFPDVLFERYLEHINGNRRFYLMQSTEHNPVLPESYLKARPKHEFTLMEAAIKENGEFPASWMQSGATHCFRERRG